jgi:hypothetical protein
MNAEERTAILNLLDFERRTVLFPGVTRISENGVIKEVSADGKDCQILYSSCPEDEVDRIIDHEVRAARGGGYELEWKVYGHDQPHCLGEHLAAAGFVPGEKEAFMVLCANQEALDRFGVCSSEIRRVVCQEDLADVQRICEEVYGKSYEKQIERYQVQLESYPDMMSLYVAYVEDEPAACGRTYFHAESRFAALYGGQTRERFRKRGLFTQIVGVRIREALRRGIAYICVDALPTSEPILRKRGFEIVTYTQPYSLFV